MDSAPESNQPFGNISMFWWVAAFLLCVVFALSHSYSSMATYDDESYVMMTIKTFLDGDRLYGETYTQYGPAYYMLQQPIHGWLGVPITHDIVRLKTVASWLLIGLLCGIVVARMTGKGLAGVTAMLLSVLYLEKLGLEPAHPQEVVAVLAMFCLVLMSSRSRSVLFLVGVCAAFAGMAKLNVGATAAVGCLFAASFSGCNSGRFNRWIAAVGCFLAVGLSAGIFTAIAKKCLVSGDWMTLAWPAIIVLSAIVICGTAWRDRFSERNEQERQTGDPIWTSPFFAVATGGIVGSIYIVAWSLIQGNSLQEILHGVVLQHSFMADSFYHPVNVNIVAIPIVLVAGVLLSRRLFHKATSVDSGSVDSILMLLPPIVLAIAIFQIGIDCWKPLVHGLNPRGAALFLATAGPILMPILLLKKSNEFRMTLAMIGCLSPLLAFPVPGTQVNLGTLPIVLGLIVASFDACELDAPTVTLPLMFCKKAIWVLAMLMLLATCTFGYRWVNNMSLDQPGCQWVRIEPERAVKEKAVAECIRLTDSDWLAFDTHNHNRYFFWTGKKPLTSISPTFWPAMLQDSEQEEIELAAQGADSICVVRLNDDRVKLGDYSPSLEKELLGGWHPIGEFGDWQVGIRLRP